MEVIGYCMKCKKKQPMLKVKKVTTAKGTPAMKGVCKQCETNMFKMGSA